MNIEKMQPPTLLELAVMVLVMSDDQAAKVMLVVGLVWLIMRAFARTWNRTIAKRATH